MMWLKKYLEDCLDCPVEVSKPKKQFGDYASNVLLKEKLDKKVLEAPLHNHPLIDRYDVVNGHVNIVLKNDLMIYQGPLACDLRMSSIHNRLEIEGYLDGQVDDYWLDLVKLINELNYSLDTYHTSFDIEKSVQKTFEKLDLGYIYRVQSSELLGGIYQMLHQALIALGRVNNE